MTEPFTTHDTMVLERTYHAPVETVFLAWADPDRKRVWFLGADSPDGDYSLDFRVGGRELSHGSPAGSDDEYTYDARYLDIVPDRRIVYANHMLRGETRISASLTSVEFRTDGDDTTLVLTEHGIYLDGEDKPEDRRAGISHQLDALGGALDHANLTIPPAPRQTIPNDIS